MEQLELSISNSKLIQWVHEVAVLCRPNSVHLCNGTQEEYDRLCQKLVRSGTFIPLNPSLRPHSFLARSTPDDVARVENRTFICSMKSEDAGPTNHWQEPKMMMDTLVSLFEGCMQGREMYIIPFSMGPIESKISKIGIQITDSPYVACNMFIMTRMGEKVLTALGDGDFVPCLHSVGVPLSKGQNDVSWPCNSENKHIVHFPESRQVWSYGSGYGGNALLGKKSLALRIASVLGRDEGWMAEHMLILGITNPEGEKKYIAAAFPSSCGKTNLAMMMPTLPGWKIETVGDDIAWMKFGPDGQLYAINPEAGIFGVAPGTSMKSNPNAMLTIQRNTIFTNVALTEDGDVWWEGMTDIPPKKAISWLNKEWTPDCGEKAAHPNARFTAPSSQCPIIDNHWQDPEGVPIAAILFGGRRSHVIPLVYEAFDWEHGTFLGASISSETTAAATGEVGKLRHDPFSMLPFCGYNMGDYFNHWLTMGKKGSRLPRIYSVNWFRKGSKGEWLWPGYGDNIRVLKWIFERTSEKGKAIKSPIGYLPTEDALDFSGLNISSDTVQELLKVDHVGWKEEVKTIRTYFEIFADRLPSGISHQLDSLQNRLMI